MKTFHLTTVSREDGDLNQKGGKGVEERMGLKEFICKGWGNDI